MSDAPIRDFQDLIVWQKAMDTVVEIYQTTGAFPASEVFGLTQQLRRASVSIPSNIAEGQGRAGNNDFPRFLRMALGSANEVMTQLELARRLRFISDTAHAPLNAELVEIRKMLHGLLRKLEN